MNKSMAARATRAAAVPSHGAGGPGGGSPGSVWLGHNRPVIGYWPLWLIGCAALLGTGFAAAYLPHRRIREAGRRMAWSATDAAIRSATVSRDASPATVAEAEQLLARAESIAAGRGGRSAARAAAGYARRADALWRAAGG
jgi:hypothetical protein